ncbi:ribonuclease H-like domain-containing protein [Obelidium mucronatum]|nr:ribonuclease H-like domain-containing protein [Obelidium mucronatum]
MLYDVLIVYFSFFFVKMEVARKSFAAVLPVLKQCIKTCDFIAIDTELSGLHKNPSEVRYEKLRSSSQSFAVLQFGVSVFEWDATLKKYVVKAFNFPIFPQAGKQLFGLDRRFLVESSAVDFLVQNGFNFDNAFKNGIPYVRFDEEELARANIDLVESIDSKSVIPLDHTNRDFVETAMSKIQDWLDNSGEPFVSILAENGFKKRLIHQEVRLRFNQTLSTRSRQKEIHVSRLSAVERQRLLNGEDEQKAKLAGELEYLIGFRRVIELISKSHKPLVGHNMYLDLCQTIQKFCFALPPTVGEFKELCHSTFPIIYDTKLIANTDQKIKELVTNSALSEMAAQLSVPPFNKPEFVMHPDFQDYLSPSASEKFHEAGYDAFSTGVSFAKMMHHIANIPDGESLFTDSTPGSDESASEARVQLNRFENKLNIMRSDEPVLNLVGDEDPIDRSNILYMSNFPTSWKTHTIVGLCQPHVGHSFVRWINSSSCFVAVSDRARVNQAAVNAIKVAVLSKRVLDGEDTSVIGGRSVRVLQHSEYLEIVDELKKEEEEVKVKESEKKKMESVPVLKGKKRIRAEDEEAEDGEILEGSGSPHGAEASNHPHKMKRQKSDSSCIIS